MSGFLYEKSLGQSTLLNVLRLLGVLNVLYVLNVLNMPMDASLACWALLKVELLPGLNMSAACHHATAHHTCSGAVRLPTPALLSSRFSTAPAQTRMAAFIILSIL